MGYSKNGTRSLLVQNWRLPASFAPVARQAQGPAGTEARVRARYVDLAINPSAGPDPPRSNVLRSIRETLFAKGFLEVETPILQQIHRGPTPTAR